MANKKASQRDRVIYELGLLLQPIQECIQSDPPNTPKKYRIAVARTQVGDATWRQSVSELATFSGDVVFKKEASEISHVPERLIGELSSLIEHFSSINDPESLKEKSKIAYEKSLNYALNQIQNIPINWEPEIFPANTPFTAYLRIREAVITAIARFHYFDRYLRPEFFRLFVYQLPRSIEIRIVTTAGNSSYGFKGVEDISNLVRQEYSDYKLIEVDPKLMHDRNLRIDDMIFTLGPGVDRAGVAVTNFGPSDSSNDAHLALDQIIQNGTVRHVS